MRVVKYRRARIVIPEAPPLTGVCEVCGKKRKTDSHHILYAYPTKKVRKNPILALDYTLELCYPHHKVAQAEMLLNKTSPEIKAKLSLLNLKVMQKMKEKKNKKK